MENGIQVEDRASLAGMEEERTSLAGMEEDIDMASLADLENGIQMEDIAGDVNWVDPQPPLHIC